METPGVIRTVARATGNPTVEEFLERWRPWAEKSLKRKTRETQLQRFADFMEWADAKRLGSASCQDVQRFAECLIESGRNRTTANNYLRDISALYGHAIKTFEMYGGPNPAQGVKRFKTEQSPAHYLEVPEIQALLEVARVYDGEHTTRLEWFFSLGICAGLRLDEIANTQWGWFDWKEKLLSVPSDKAFFLKSQKGRTVPLSERLGTMLEQHAIKSGYLFDSGRESEGRSHYRYYPKRSFRTICKEADLDTVTRWDIPKRVTPHVLRHTFGTQHAKAGVSIYKICEWLGHSDVKITMLYAHVQGYDKDIDSF